MSERREVEALRLSLGVSARLLTAFLCGVLLVIAQDLLTVHVALGLVAPALAALFWTATLAATPHVRIPGVVQAFIGLAGVVAALYFQAVTGLTGVVTALYAVVITSGSS